MRSPRSLALATLAALSFVAAPARANDAMGLAGLAAVGGLCVGVVALVLAAVLGALAWGSTLRPPQTVGGVFGRGFLSVSAVVAFAVGGLGLCLGLELWLESTPLWALWLVATATMVFLAIEFFLAGTLYRRTNARRPGALAKGLAVTSYTLAALLSACTLVLTALVAFSALIPEGQVESSEVRRYRKGCERGAGGDCNMLGLRYQTGAPGLPADASKAAAAFEKSCGLGAPAGCRNLAALYRSGEGVAKSDDLAAEYERRSEALSTPGAR